MESVSLTFITGGVRSGKSRFAEKVAMDMASEMDGSLHYIATAKPTDAEMVERIHRHRIDREKSGYIWTTWEQDMSVSSLANQFSKNDIVLLDCLTTLLSNELFAYDVDQTEFTLDKKLLFQQIWDDLMHLQENCNHLILVSNEVLQDPIYPSELVMTYCELLGKLHQNVVRFANSAYLVEAGIPLLMKGEEL